MDSSKELTRKICSMPDSPGVYLMKDERGAVIYVGKAKSLKKRLYSYLGSGLDVKTASLMRNVSDIEYRLAQTESLALLLEASLIREHKPKYNVSLRDDKSFPLVKITNEEFPAVCVTRKKEDDGARYFGPYMSASLLREALRILRRNFPYRSCKRLPKKACIYYRIGLSPAPCTGKISKKEYARTIEEISLILEGKVDELVKKLSVEMLAKSKERRFEEASKIRDQISALSAIVQGNACGVKPFGLEDLKRLLGLDKLPQRIEAFDISNISGSLATGSMASFYNGLPDKSNYRRFRISSVKGTNDYKMLGEVVHRRYRRLIEEKLPLPELILIDGGRSHLLAAEKELKALGISVPLVSIAKGQENIYTNDRVMPIKLKTDTPALNLIRRIRDEAHRFAVSYHRVLRRKKIIGR